MNRGLTLPMRPISVSLQAKVWLDPRISPYSMGVTAYLVFCSSPYRLLSFALSKWPLGTKALGKCRNNRGMNLPCPTLALAYSRCEHSRLCALQLKVMPRKRSSRWCLIFVLIVPVIYISYAPNWPRSSLIRADASTRLIRQCDGCNGERKVYRGSRSSSALNHH